MLRVAGYEFIFSPHPIVGHRIQHELISPVGIRRRVINEGRGSARIYGLCHEKLLQRSVLSWCSLRFGSLLWSVVRYLNPLNYITGSRGYASRLEALCDIAYNIESFRMLGELAKHR
jgi:hypothetical protein